MIAAIEWDGTLITIAVVAFGFVVATPYVRRRRTQASIDYGAKALALAQAELQTEREARNAQEARCNEKIAQLTGRVDFLTESFAQIIAAQVAIAVMAAMRADAKQLAADVAEQLREEARAREQRRTDS